MFRKLKVVLSLIFGILSLNGLSTGVQGQSSEIPANEPTCYGAPAMVFREPGYKALQQQFFDLEKMHSNGKIDDKTYKIKSKSLKEKMSTFEDNYYKKPQKEAREGE